MKPKQAAAAPTVKRKPPNTGDDAVPGKYCIGPRRSISIFGGYPVRTVLKPDGTPLITLQLVAHTDEALDQLDNLVKALNRE